MANPRPTPVALRKARGNPSKRPIPKEPKLRKELPKAPAHLTDVAREEWDRVVQDLYDAGLLLPVDRTALASYCMTYARWVDAEQHLADEGLMLKAKTGGRYQNPFLAVATRSMLTMLKFMVEFGMTPSSRSKVSTAQEEKDDPFERWVASKLDGKEGDEA